MNVILSIEQASRYACWAREHLLASVREDLVRSRRSRIAAVSDRKAFNDSVELNTPPRSSRCDGGGRKVGEEVQRLAHYSASSQRPGALPRNILDRNNELCFGRRLSRSYRAAAWILEALLAGVSAGQRVFFFVSSGEDQCSCLCVCVRTTS